MFGPGGFRFDKVNPLGAVRLVVEDTFGRQATWEGTISMGSDKHFKPLRAPGLEIPEWMEGREWLRELGEDGPIGPPDPGPVVGWSVSDEGGVMPQSALVTQTILRSPELADDVVVVCTTPQVMKTGG